MALGLSCIPAVVLIVEDEMMLRMRAVEMVEDAVSVSTRHRALVEPVGPQPVWSFRIPSLHRGTAPPLSGCARPGALRSRGRGYSAASIVPSRGDSADSKALSA